MKRISCWILAGALLVVVIPNILVLSQAESEQRQGMIAFVSDRFAPFRYEIYGMNPDGSSQRMLTESMGMGASSTDFAWSPDGAQMAFVSDLGASDSNIWVMNADGSNPHMLTNNGSSPAWSPDGEQIAFSANRGDGTEIYVMSADGSDVRRLTESLGNDILPVWSPDGREIAFLTFRSSKREIYLMHADGSDQRPLTNLTGEEGFPAWSPDGRRIAFAANPNGGWNLYLVNADGIDLHQLPTSPNADAYGPVWSPDGTRIAYVSKDESSPAREVFVMNWDGTGLLNLSQSAGDDVGPTWSPDGTRIAFLSDRDGPPSGIYVIQADGSGLRRLTFHDGDLEPLWSPGTIGPAVEQSATSTSVEPCPADFTGFLAPRLSPEQRAVVLPGADQRVRAAPSTNSEQIGAMPSGTEFTIMAGPSCDAAASIIWWQIRTDAGLMGWTAEGLLPNEYFIEPG